MRMRFVIMAATFFAATALPGANATAEIKMRRMTFDEAAPELIIRSLPLNVALPSSYELFKNEPVWGTWLWTTRESYDHLQSHGSALLNVGAFQIKITTGVGYMRD